MQSGLQENGRVKFMQGNEACALGALEAGINFYAGYPITPSTEIAEILSRRLPCLGGVFIQMEDEIASLAAVIGASLGGAKAMTATSGPGFSLMQEHIGYAAATEIPCVIVNVQRAGPSTGQPTSPSQGDVMQSRWGSHGDYPIIVLYPSSVYETYILTIRAFNLSERYRTPVILLTDEVIAHMREKVVLPPPGSIEVVKRTRPEIPPEWYFPFNNEAHHFVPPLVSFGEGYRYHVTGLFHDKAGFPTYRSDEINPWFQRLFKKIEANSDDIIDYKTENIKDAEIVLVSYGCSARSAHAAMKRGRENGIKIGMIKLYTIWPFAEEVIKMIAQQVKLIVVPEMNRGQLLREVERCVEGKTKVRGVNRCDGEMITPSQILEAIESEVMEVL